MHLEFDQSSHTYRLDGREVPSVTAVLDPLHVWDGIPPDVLEEARERGGYVHAACDQLDRDELDWSTLPDGVEPFVRGYENWLRDSGSVVVAGELRVANPAMRYAGTLDRLAEVKGVPSVIDIKATAVMPATVGPQTAAYVEALKATTGLVARRRHCLHLNPKHPRGYKLHTLPDSADWSVFVSALNIYNWRKRHA